MLFLGNPILKAIVSEVLKEMPSTISERIYGFFFMSSTEFAPRELCTFTAVVAEIPYC